MLNACCCGLISLIQNATSLSEGNLEMKVVSFCYCKHQFSLLILILLFSLQVLDGRAAPNQDIISGTYDNVFRSLEILAAVEPKCCQSGTIRKLKQLIRNKVPIIFASCSFAIYDIVCQCRTLSILIPGKYVGFRIMDAHRNISDESMQPEGELI